MAVSPPFVSCLWFLVDVTVSLTPASELLSVDALVPPCPCNPDGNCQCPDDPSCGCGLTDHGSFGCFCKGEQVCACLDYKYCPEPPPTCECSEGSCRCPEECECGLFGEPPVNGCRCEDRPGTCLCSEECQLCPSELHPPPRDLVYSCPDECPKRPPPPPACPCSEEGYCQCLDSSCSCGKTSSGGTRCFDCKEPSAICTCPDKCPKCQA